MVFQYAGKRRRPQILSYFLFVSVAVNLDQLMIASLLFVKIILH